MQERKPSANAAAGESFQRREVRAVSAGGTVRIDLQRDGHHWVLDEPLERSGSDAGPSPVKAFLGALMGCMIITYQLAGQRRDVPIARIEGRVTANANRYVDAITLELDIWSPGPAEQVEALLERVRRGCYVSHVLKPEIDFQVVLRVHPAEPAV